MASSGLQSVGDAVTLADSCVIIDVLVNDPVWAAWSARALAAARDTGELVINPIVYAEVAAVSDTVEALDDVLPTADFVRQPLPYEAGFLAAHALRIYRRRGGTKRAPLPDFYIGAHAAVRGYRLLTRDVTRYRGYFPTVELIAPDH